MSDLSIPAMSEHDARRLTERIRIAAVNYSEAKDKLMALVQEAKDGSAHLTLGYASWTAYLAEVLGEEPMRLARGERQEMVQMLSAEGMSTRAIAPIVGAHHDTVASDIKAASVGNPTDQPRTVESMDGITRTFQPRTEPNPESETVAEVPEPAKPKRRPLTDQSNEAGWELAKSVEKIERIITDDRMAANREVVTNHLKQHLINSIDKLTILLNTL